MLIEQNEQFREVVKNFSDIVLILDANTLIRYVNPSAERVLGYTPEDIVGTSILNYSHPEDILEIKNRFATGVDKPGIKTLIEARIRHKKGHWVYFEANYNNLLNDPDIKGIVVNARDITHRKQIEEALRKSEEKMRGIFESVLDGIIVTDMQGNIIQVNDSLAKIYKYKKEEIIGQNVFNFIKEGEQNQDLAAQIMKYALNKGRVENVEYTSMRKDGSVFPIEISAAVFKDTSGNPIGFVSIIKDITGRKKIEDALRKSEERYYKLFNTVPVGIGVTDMKGNTLDANMFTLNMTGYTREDFETTGLGEIYVNPEERKKIINILQTKGKVEDFEVKLKKRDGTVFWGLINAEFITIENKKLILSSVRDITERRQTEEKLKETEERFRTLFDNIRDGVLVADIETQQFFTGNKMICKMLGYNSEEIKRLSLADIHPKEDLSYVVEQFKKQVRGEIIVARSLPVIRKNNSIFYADVNTSLITLNKKTYIMGIFTDITERKKMEEIGKLVILGQLAGGVAHELRNPLGAIKNTAYFLNMAIKNPKSEIKEAIEILNKEVKNSDRIISSLLYFANPKAPTQRQLDINKIINESLSRIKIPKSIKVLKKSQEKLPLISADPDHMNQVFGNIILNAVQAMPEGGKLTIKTEIENSKGVAISFADTGIGIPESTINKIFEPFFSTKAKGIGLGLAITKILVEQNRGTIEVKSKVGKGTTFTVKLPVG